MNFRSLVPTGDRNALMRPEVAMFGSLQREMDRLFDEFARGIGPLSAAVAQNLIPRIDMTENDNEIEITVELPGLERQDVDISLDNDVLTIRGEKKLETETGQQDNRDNKENKDSRSEKNSNKNYHLSERSYGIFYRVLQLPPGIDANAAQATMSNGILNVRIPKSAQSVTKKIEVKDAA